MLKPSIYLATWLLLGVALMAKPPLMIVTSTTDLADIAKAIGGHRTEVVSLSRGNQDAHSVEAKPSMVMKLKKADLVIRIGMDLDGWMNSLIETARNPQLVAGSTHILDASNGISKLEVPQGKIDGSMGDIHVQGNPHYWLDPENGRIILKRIYVRLCQISPEDSGYFKDNYETYDRQLSQAIAKWKSQLSPYQNAEIVTYHASLPYFSKAFRLRVMGYVELKPGIPPTPRHLVDLVKYMRESKVRVVMMEPWQNEFVAKKIASETDSQVMIFAPSVGSVAGVTSYIGLFEYNVGQILSVLR